MLNQLLPERIDNSYRGHKVALWLFGLLLLMRTVMSVNSIFNAPDVLVSADGIPLQTYPAAAARTIVALFALLGASNLLFCVLGVLALIRYRSMVPLLFGLMLMYHLSARAILFALPIPRTRSPGLVINLVLLGVMIVGFALSLWRRERLA